MALDSGLFIGGAKAARWFRGRELPEEATTGNGALRPLFPEAGKPPELLLN